MNEEQKNSLGSAEATEPAKGVTFGARGCLTTLAGLALGGLVGVGFAYGFVVRSGYEWNKDVGALILLVVGWAFGATLGALYGAVIGSKRL